MLLFISLVTPSIYLNDVDEETFPYLFVNLLLFIFIIYIFIIYYLFILFYILLLIYPVTRRNIREEAQFFCNTAVRT